MAVIAGYELLGAVSSGSTGTVLKAHDGQLDRTVALKRLDDPTDVMRERWRAEARLLAQLDDPHIVGVFGYLEDDGQSYIVEEWVEGATLAAVMSRHGKLGAEQALGVIRGALLGLAHAHDRDVVHGDVSPSNVLVDETGTSRLIDFGLATPTGSSSRSGAAAYRSPEVEAGQPATPASDVYSAAALLTHLLTGTSTGHPSADGVDRALRDVVRRALSPDPDMRFPEAGTFLAALEEGARSRYGSGWWTEVGMAALASGSGATLVTQATERIRLARHRRRIKIPGTTASVPLLGAVAAVGAVALGLVVAMAQRSDAPRPSPAAVVASSTRPVSTPAAPGASGQPTSPTPSATPSTSPSASTAAPGPAASPSPLLLPAAERVKGVYRIRAAYTTMNARLVRDSAGKVLAKVGDTVPYGNWTINPSCDASGSCKALVTSPDGFNYNVVLADGHWRGRSPVAKASCVVGTGTLNVQIDVDFIDPTRGDGTPPATMSGRTVQHYGTGCNSSGTAATSLLLTRITP